MPSPAPLTDDDIDAVCEALLAFYASPMACWRLSGDPFGAHKRHTLTALSQLALPPCSTGRMSRTP